MGPETADRSGQPQIETHAPGLEITPPNVPVTGINGALRRHPRVDSECFALLNRAGLLIWDNDWWQWPHIWLIVVAYCLPFVVVVWCHDHLSKNIKAIAAVVVPLLAVACHLVLATWLNWI